MVARLAWARGLTLDFPLCGSIAKAPWWARFDILREAWCKANGLMHPEYRQIMDWRRAGEAGIDMSGSSRYRLRLNDGRDVPWDLS